VLYARHCIRYLCPGNGGWHDRQQRHLSQLASLFRTDISEGCSCDITVNCSGRLFRKELTYRFIVSKG
jgi:hypothetical protein